MSKIVEVVIPRRSTLSTNPLFDDHEVCVMSLDLAESQGAEEIRCRVQGEAFARTYTVTEVRAFIQKRPEFHALRGLSNVEPGLRGIRNAGPGRHMVLNKPMVPSPHGLLVPRERESDGRIVLTHPQARKPSGKIVVTGR